MSVQQPIKVMSSAVATWRTTFSVLRAQPVLVCACVLFSIVLSGLRDDLLRHFPRETAGLSFDAFEANTSRMLITAFLMTVACAPITFVVYRKQLVEQTRARLSQFQSLSFGRLLLWMLIFRIAEGASDFYRPARILWRGVEIYSLGGLFSIAMWGIFVYLSARTLLFGPFVSTVADASNLKRCWYATRGHSLKIIGTLCISACPLYIAAILAAFIPHGAVIFYGVTVLIDLVRAAMAAVIYEIILKVSMSERIGPNIVDNNKMP